MNNVIGPLAILALIGLLTYNYVCLQAIGETVELQITMFVVIGIVLGALVLTRHDKKK